MPSNAENLIPYRFKPGQSGNPGGSSKRQRLTRALELVARTRVPEGPKAGRRWYTAMALGLAEAAAKGDPAAFKQYADRVEGPSRDDRDSGPPQIVVNMISIAPQQKQPDTPQLVINGEAIGKTN